MMIFMLQVFLHYRSFNTIGVEVRCMSGNSLKCRIVIVCMRMNLLLILVGIIVSVEDEM